MWIVSGPRVYVAVFLSGMFCGFALGVSATRAHAAENYICADITVPIMPYCTIKEQADHFPATGCTVAVDGHNYLCFTPTPDQMKAYRRIKEGK